MENRSLVRPCGGAREGDEAITMLQTTLYRPGQQIRYTAVKANGEPYRWNDGWVAEIYPDCIVLVVPAGTPLDGPKGGGAPARYHTRHWVWLNRPFNLFESYDPDGTPCYLYLNIAAPPVLGAAEIRYTDYELDLAKRHDQDRVELLDKDEFEEAATQFGYSVEFQRECWAAVAEAQAVLEGWVWHPEGAPPPIQPGQTVRFAAHKADGEVYRFCNAQVESVTPDYVVLTYPSGTPFHGTKGGWSSRPNVRAHLWTNRPYNLLEGIDPQSGIIELYMNIASPAQLLPGEVRYTDYELDVVKQPGESAQVEDADEFQEAIARYGYTDAFQQTCWEAVAQALDLIESWPLPTTPPNPKR